MFKLDQVTRFTTNITLKDVALLIFAVGLFWVITGNNTAFAASFYGTTQNTDCGGDIKLIVPYTPDGAKGKSYYCVSGLINSGPSSEISGANTTTKSCDPGVASYGQPPFGALCLTNLQSPSIDCTKDTSCNLVDSGSQKCGNGKDLCGIFSQFLTPLVNLLSGVVGIVVIIMIVIGGIQYSSAGGDPQKVAGAKQRIVNALLALLAYALLFAFLQWIVPGGIV